MADFSVLTADNELDSRYSSANPTSTLSSVIPAVVLAFSMQAVALATAKHKVDANERTATSGHYHSHEATMRGAIHTQLNAEVTIEAFVEKILARSKETPVNIARAINARLFELL